MGNVSHINEAQDIFLGTDLNKVQIVQILEKISKPEWSSVTIALISVILVENNAACFNYKTSTNKRGVNSNRLNYILSSLEFIYVKPIIKIKTLVHIKSITNNKHQYYSHEMLSSAASSTESSGHTESSSKNSLNSSESVDTKLHRIFGTSNTYKTKREQVDNQIVKSVNVYKPGKSRLLANSQLGSHTRPIVPMERKSSLQEQSTVNKDKIQIRKPKKDVRRAEIVASVTRRLYTNKKKLETKTESEEAPTEQKDEDEEPEELKLCSRARAKLQELGRKALLVQRKIKPVMVDAECETDFHLHVQRVKEKCVGTDYSVMNVSVGTDCSDLPCYVQRVKEVGVATDPPERMCEFHSTSSNQIICSCNMQQTKDRHIELYLPDQQTKDKATETDYSCYVCRAQQLKEVVVAIDQNNSPGIFHKFKTVNSITDQHNFPYNLQGNRRILLEGDYHNNHCLFHKTKEVSMKADQCEHHEPLHTFKEVAVGTDVCKHTCCCNTVALESDTHESSMSQESTEVSIGKSNIQSSTDQSNSPSLLQSTKELNVGTDQHNFTCHMQAKAVAVGTTATCRSVGSDTRENSVHFLQQTRHIISSNLIGDQGMVGSLHSYKTFKINQSECHHYIMRRSLGTETTSLPSWGNTNSSQTSGYVSHLTGEGFGSLLQQYNLVRPTVWNYFPTKTANQFENQRYMYQNTVVKKQMEECFSDDSLDSSHDIELTTDVETDSLNENPMESFIINNDKNVFHRPTECFSKREPIKDNFRCNVHHNFEAVSDTLNSNNIGMSSQGRYDGIQDIPSSLDICKCRAFPLRVTNGMHRQEHNSKPHHCNDFNQTTSIKCDCGHIKPSSSVRKNDHIQYLEENKQPFIGHNFISSYECCKPLQHDSKIVLNVDNTFKGQCENKNVPQGEKLCSSCRISHSDAHNISISPNPCEPNNSQVAANDRLLYTINESNDQYESNDITSHVFSRSGSPRRNGHALADLQYSSCNSAQPKTPNVSFQQMALSPDHHTGINMKSSVLRNCESVSHHHINKPLQDPVSHNKIIKCKNSSTAETLNVALCISCNKCLLCNQQFQRINTNYSASAVNMSVTNNDISDPRSTSVHDNFPLHIESNADRFTNHNPEEVSILHNNWPDSSLQSTNSSMSDFKPESMVNIKPDQPSIITSHGFPTRLQSEAQHCIPINTSHICDIHSSIYKVPDINTSNVNTRGENKSSSNSSKDQIAVQELHSEDKNSNSNNNYCCSLNIPSFQISACSSLEEHTKKHIQRIEKCIRKYYYKIVESESCNNEPSSSSNSELPINQILQTNITPLPKTFQLHRLDTLVIFDKPTAVKHPEKVPSKLMNDSSNNKTVDELSHIIFSDENVVTDTCTENKFDDTHALYKAEIPKSHIVTGFDSKKAEENTNVEFKNNNDMKTKPDDIHPVENFEIQLLSTNALNAFCDELVNVQPQLILQRTYKSDSSTSIDSSIIFLFKGQDYQPLLTDMTKKDAEQNQSGKENVKYDITQVLNCDHNCSSNSKDPLKDKTLQFKYNSNSDCDYDNDCTTVKPIISSQMINHTNTNKALQYKTHFRKSTGISLQNASGYDNMLKNQTGKSHKKHVSWPDLCGSGSLCIEMAGHYDNMLSDSSTSDISSSPPNPTDSKFYRMDHYAESSWLNEPYYKSESNRFDHTISKSKESIDILPLQFPSEDFCNLNDTSRTSSGRDSTEQLSYLTGATLRSSEKCKPADNEIKQFTISSSIPKKKNARRKKRCVPLVSPLSRWNFMDVSGLATQGWGNGGALGTWFSLSAFIKKANALLKSLNEVSHMMSRKKNAASKQGSECDPVHIELHEQESCSSTTYRSSHSKMSQKPIVSIDNQHPKIKTQCSSELGLKIEQDLPRKLNHCKEKLDLRKEENPHIVLSPIGEYDDEISCKLKHSALHLSSLNDNNDPSQYETNVGSLVLKVCKQEPETLPHLRNTAHIGKMLYDPHFSTRKKYDYKIGNASMNEGLKPVTRLRIDSRNDVSRNLEKPLLEESQLLEEVMLPNQEQTTAHPISEDYKPARSTNFYRSSLSQSTKDVPKQISSNRNKIIADSITNTKLFNKENMDLTAQNSSVIGITTDNSHSNINTTERLTYSEFRECSTPYSENTNISFLKSKVSPNLPHTQMQNDLGLRSELANHTFDDNQQMVLHPQNKFDTQTKRSQRTCLEYYQHSGTRAPSLGHVYTIPNINESFEKYKLPFNQESSSLGYKYIPSSIHKSNHEYPHSHSMKHTYDVSNSSSKSEAMVKCSSVSNNGECFLDSSSYLSRSVNREPHSAYIRRNSNGLHYQPQWNLCSSCNRNHRLPTVGSTWTSHLSFQEYNSKLPVPKVHRALVKESTELVVPRTSPRAYMQHLLQLRRQIVVASGFSTRPSSSQHKQIKNS